MSKYKLEYIWLDGKKPVPELRGKTLIKSFEKPPTLGDLPKWGFDGSSTMQAEGHSSDCGVGYKYMGNVARTIVEEHLELCHAAGINHEGINAEVAKGQWEFQIFAKGSTKAADDMWTARYLMMRLCEKYEVDMELYCKPIKGDWNGSGMHCNFSTKYFREVGGKEYLEAVMKAFADNVAA